VKHFCKPLAVINAFRSSGIYPEDSSSNSSEALKPGLAFTKEETTRDEGKPNEKPQTSPQSDAQGALEALERAIPTPVRLKYTERVNKGYEAEESSPCFNVYRTLHTKAQIKSTVDSEKSANTSLEGLDLLASTVVALEGRQQSTSNAKKEEHRRCVQTNRGVVPGTSCKDCSFSLHSDIPGTSKDTQYLPSGT